MIRLIGEAEENFFDFCNADVFGTRILAFYLSYGWKYPFAQFWSQTNDENEITATLCLVDGNMTLCAGDNADITEIVEFIRRIGFDTLQGDRRILQNFDSEEAVHGMVLQFNERKKEFPEISINENPDLREIYKIISAENLTGVGEFDSWFPDVSHRVRHGIARAAAVQCDGKTAACAMVLFETANAALLGAVATAPEYRARGYAGAIVSFLADECLNSGKRVNLLCANTTIYDFYKSIGFLKISEWTIIKG